MYSYYCDDVRAYFQESDFSLVLRTEGLMTTLTLTSILGGFIVATLVTTLFAKLSKINLKIHPSQAFL